MIKTQTLTVCLTRNATGQLEIFGNFPVEVNKADYLTLLRVPGIGVISAKRIIKARRAFCLNFEDLKNLKVVMKRARYFITCNGKYFDNIQYFKPSFISQNLLVQERRSLPSPEFSQLNIFNDLMPVKEDAVKCLTGIL